MKRYIFWAKFAIFLGSSYGLQAGTVPLHILSNNFPLKGGGGGASAILNGEPVESFCDDFANSILAGGNYTANVTQLSTTANLDDTRFGQITTGGWQRIKLKGKSATVIADNAFFNTGAGSTALARYEMAAFLVSLYDRPAGNNTANNQIQEAIWSLMDPKTSGTYNPSGTNPIGDLELAANWYRNMNTLANQSALNDFLASFEILSPVIVNTGRKRKNRGFQEQIVDPPHAPLTPTPEPRDGIFLVIALLGAGVVLARRGHHPLWRR